MYAAVDIANGGMLASMSHRQVTESWLRRDYQPPYEQDASFDLQRSGVLHCFMYGYNPTGGGGGGGGEGGVFPGLRPRSGSLGSTGSSVRSGRFSPSYETNYEGFSDAISRQSSPISDAPSPSPPPRHQSSKLMGILKGTLSSPYSAIDDPAPWRTSLKRRCAQDAPIDLSCKRPRRQTRDCLSALRDDCWQTMSTTTASSSILKSILCRGDNNAGGLSCNDGDSTRPVCHNARVALAKKNLLPATARVSDWLTRTVLFAKAIPEFNNLVRTDQLTLLVNAWPRLLLLHMAETNFQFVVAPLSGADDNRYTDTDGDHPTMKFVDNIQGFISKCQSLNFDQLEYEYIRMATLFHTGYTGIKSSAAVEKFNSYVRRVLQGHVERSHPTDKLRYSNILLCMPMLFGINCRMLETLFCRHIASRAEGTGGLLREMLCDEDGAII